MAEMHDVGKMPAFCNEAAQRLAVLSVEKLVWKDITKPSFLVKQLQAAFNKHDVNVVVPFASSKVTLLVVLDFQWRPLLHGLDTDVRRIANHHIKSPSAMLHPLC